MTNYSRLGRIQQRETQKQIVFIVLAAVVLVFLLVKFGLPALFGLTSTLSGLKNSGRDSAVENNLEIPSRPALISDFTATKSASIKINGTADAQINVSLFQDNQPVSSTLTDQDGKFTFNVNLSAGTNRFTAQATDNKGKKSDLSEVLEISLLTGQPKLEISFPADQQVFANLDSIDITGKTDAGNTVTVNDRAAIVDSAGLFRYFLRLSKGDIHLKIAATDPAGTSTTKELTIKSN